MACGQWYPGHKPSNPLFVCSLWSTDLSWLSMNGQACDIWHGHQVASSDYPPDHLSPSPGTMPCSSLITSWCVTNFIFYASFETAAGLIFWINLDFLVSRYNLYNLILAEKSLERMTYCPLSTRHIVKLSQRSASLLQIHLIIGSSTLSTFGSTRKNSSDQLINN